MIGAAVHVRPSFEIQVRASDPSRPTARTPSGPTAMSWIRTLPFIFGWTFQVWPSIESTKTGSLVLDVPAATKRSPVQTTSVSWVSLLAA